MSAQLVRQEILAFLRTSDPSVHCIRGRWGVGKTFTWNRALLETRQDKSHSLKDYAYVSLFGMNSLEDVKSAIFENTVQLPKPDIAPSLESLRENLLRLGKGWRSIGRIGTWATTRSTWLRNYVGAFGPLCFATVTDRIICIDDIERRGEGLDVSDVLGLASYLKENRRCKIALILNDEALESQESDFRKYFEKVVDVSLSFTPTNKECIEIGLRGETPDDVYLAQCCGKLNISNIRVLRKIAHLVDKCKPLLLSYDRSVTLQAIHSIALLSWCIHEPHLAPPLSYLTDHKRFVIGKGKEDLPKDQAAWNSLLDHYEFGPLDDFEFVLLDGIKSGFFDASRLEECARAPHSRAEERDFSSAWETYHSTFANNEEEVLDVLFGSFQKNVKSISLTNLSGTVKLFKELGARERATELIALYLECHGDSEAVMDLAKSPWGTADIDPDVIKALAERLSGFGESRDPVKLLLSIAGRHAWNDKGITFLSNLPVADYFKVLKTVSGEDLHSILYAIFDFGGDAGSSGLEHARDERLGVAEALASDPAACRTGGGDGDHRVRDGSDGGCSGGGCQRVCDEAIHQGDSDGEASDGWDPRVRSQRTLQAGERIRVLVVDDSVVIRQLVTQVLAEDPLLEVVGVAANGAIALQRIPQLNPDVLTLDIEMPEMDGLETLRHLRRDYSQLRVIMFSTLTERGAAATMDALTLGADDYVTKFSNEGSLDRSMARLRGELIPKVKQFFRLPGEEATRSPVPSGSPTLAAVSFSTKVRPRVLAIGVSTGGPAALGTILPKLPAGFPLPVMVVQHMPPLFTQLLAERLHATCQLPTEEAQPGKAVEAGKILIAPGDFHLKVASVGGVPRVSLDQSPPLNSCRPAVDALFSSIAEVYGGAVIAVVLTGMGQDGLRGVEILRARGASVLAQDEATSVVWGMPGAVARAGLADRILPLDEVVPEILRLSGRW